MSTARVIHFGSDGFQRVQALQQVGLKVLALQSLDRLRLHLERNAEVDAVLVSEETSQGAEQAAALVRQRSAAPLILFRRSEAALDESRFDRIYASAVPPPFWLFDTAVLVEQCRTLRAQAKRLRKESEAVRRKSEWQRARARVQVKRNATAKKPPEAGRWR